MKHKLTINRLAWNTIKHRKKQYIVLIVSIVLAMIFSSGVPMFFSCINSSLEQMQLKQIGRQDCFLMNAQELPLEELQQNQTVTGEFGYIHTLSYLWHGEKEDRGTELGWMDERAQELYFPQLKEGRLPEKAGEIAIEEDALLRMGLEPELNAEISFHVRTHDEAGYLPETSEKSYILVGILGNRRPIYERYYYDFGHNIPAAFTAPGEQTEIGGKESLIVLLQQDQNNPVAYGDFLIAARNQHFGLMHEGNFGNAGMELMRNGHTIAFIFLLLAFLTCFSIMNAFGTLLKERTAQIGMMRAVGATRRQIFWIFGRETLLLALICAPVSLVISLGGIWLYAGYMGDNFIFAPNFGMLGLGILFSLFCVMAAAMIPLFSVSRLAPIQAIRNVSLSKKMRHRKIRSRKSFSMPQLLAARKSTFSKGRNILIRLMIAVTTVICCFSAVFFISSVKFADITTEKSDYLIYPTGWKNPDNHYIYSENESFISEIQSQEVLNIPLVRNVYGTKNLRVNLLLDEVPKFLQLFELQDVYEGRFESANLFSDENLPMTEEKLFHLGQAKERTAYTETKTRAGYDQEVLTIEVNSADSAHFKELFPYQVAEGRIDLEALNSGNEVVLYAPQKIGFLFHPYLDGSCMYGVQDTSPEYLKRMDPIAKSNLDYIISSAENPFHAGDELTIGMLFENPDGSLRRVDREVKIGAIVRDSHEETGLKLLTTNEALEIFGQPFPYSELYVDCSEEFSGELDMEMQNAFAAACPSKGIISTYETNRSGQSRLRQMSVSFTSLIAVLFVVCISLINNGITAQIREDRRSIGTLRAVGASQRDITQCYHMQIVRTLLWGSGIGLAVTLALSFALHHIFYLLEIPFIVGILPAFVLLAALLCAGLLNLHIQVKKISRQSIVDNIREL